MRGPLRSVLAVCLLTVLPCAAQTTITEPYVADAGVGLLEIAVLPTEITVGDRVEVRLTLVWTGRAPSSGPRFPQWQETWGEAEVLSAGEIEALDGPGERRIYWQDLVLTAFSVGEVQLPPVTVALPLDGETIEIGGDRSAGFEVRSVLPEEPEEPLPRPVSPPRVLGADQRFAWTAAGLGGLSLLMAWLLRRRLRMPIASAASPPAEPLTELMRLLQRLDATVAEPAHTGLSLGLRGFLGRSLGFAAAESTTSEIERRLRRVRLGPQAGDDALWLDVVRLLRDCDQVKFAQVPVPTQVTRGRLRQARDLGYRINRGLNPVPEVAAEEAR